MINIKSFAVRKISAFGMKYLPFADAASEAGLPVMRAASGLHQLLLEAFGGGALVATSANRSGEAPCLRPEQAAQRFPEVPQLGPVPWPQPSGEASTVLRWLETGSWEVLRQGAVVPIELDSGSTT